MEPEHLAHPRLVLLIPFIRFFAREKDNGEHDPTRVNIVGAEIYNDGSGENSYFFDKLCST